jgi:hypothetical protein
MMMKASVVQIDCHMFAMVHELVAVRSQHRANFGRAINPDWYDELVKQGFVFISRDWIWGRQPKQSTITFAKFRQDNPGITSRRIATTVQHLI